MKVFALKARGYYGGGMAIVAAEDAETAMAMANAVEDSVWHVNYAEAYEVTELPVVATAAGVLAHHETGE